MPLVGEFHVSVSLIGLFIFSMAGIKKE